MAEAGVVVEGCRVRAAAVARFCGVTARTVRVWVAEGRIPHYVLPGGEGEREIVRFDLEEIRVWLAGRARGGRYDAGAVKRVLAEEGRRIGEELARAERRRR